MKLNQNLTGKIEAIVNLAGYWGELMPKKPGRRMKNGKQREWNGLVTLLGDFSTFATDYGTILSNAPTSNQRVIVNNGVERLLRNFDILSRASEQRRGTINKNSPGYHLARAEDKLSEYCDHWLPNSKFHPSYVTLKTPVAYFEKIYGISRALYTPEIPIISIPLTDYNNTDGWLALAHEMGHHIYWNSLVGQEEVKQLHDNMYEIMAKKLKYPSGELLLEPWGQWMEEVFADICGVLLGGVNYVISTQNVAAEKIKSKEDFSKNDGVHPCSYLRPWIALRVLQNIAGKIMVDQAILQKVEIRWKTFCLEASEIKCDCGKRGNISLGDLQIESEPIVDSILYEKLWPKNQRLVDLFQFDTQNIDETWLESIPSLFQNEPVRPLEEEDIPESIKETWEFIKKHIPDKKGETHGERSKREWDALVNLSVEDQHGHWPIGAHQTPLFHWWAPWAGTHTHNAGIV